MNGMRWKSTCFGTKMTKTKAEWGESGVDFECGMVALAPETEGGFKIVRKAEWGESGVDFQCGNGGRF